MSTKETIQYETSGTCCQLIQVTIEDNKICNAEFMGGCNGNLKGIKNLINGMEIDEVIEKLSGITCNGKPTSCPDQLSKCLAAYKESKQKAKV